MKNMKKSLKLGGFGGQGVITLATMISECVIGMGKEVVQTQAYVAIARGGSVFAEIVISDEKIDYPRAISPDYMVLLSADAAKAYKKQINKNGGVYIIDSTTVTKLKSKKLAVHKVPAAQISKEEWGTPKYANMILFGAISVLTGLYTREAAENSVAQKSSGANLPINQKALAKGFEIGETLKIARAEEVKQAAAV